MKRFLLGIIALAMSCVASAQYTPPPGGGFTAGGDLSGTSTSQTVVQSSNASGFTVTNGPLIVGIGNPTTPTISFAANTNYGLYFASNGIRFSTGGVNKLNLNMTSLFSNPTNTVDLGSSVSMWRTIYTAGGYSAAIKTITSATTQTVNDFTVLCNASAGAVTYTALAQASVPTGMIINFKKIDSSVNACTFSAPVNIDGSGTLSIITQYQSRQIQNDGTQWWTE